MKYKVHYLRGMHGEQKLIVQYADIIVDFIKENRNGKNLERLNVDSNYPLYSIRINKRDRLLFTISDGCLYLLDEVLNHNYSKSPFLKGKVLTQHMNKVVEQDIPTAEEKVSLSCSEDGDELEIEFKPFEYYQSKIITLSDNQEKIHTSSLPLIVSGQAGSGKTITGLSILREFSLNSQKSNDKARALYISESKRLIDSIQQLWLEQAVSKCVEFISYEDLFQQVNNDNMVELAQTNDFSCWLQTYKTHLKKINKACAHNDSINFNAISEQELWREFRICSGYDNESYTNLGNKQTNFDSETRKTIFSAFENFKQSLQRQGKISVELSQPTISPDFKLYDLIVVDEAQDLSYNQLFFLYQLCTSGKIIFFLGDHQILNDGKSRVDYLKQLLYMHNDTQKINVLTLPKNYRCPQQIIELTNDVIDIKYQLTGGAADKLESKALCAIEQSNKQGYISWLGHTQFKEFLAIDNITERSDIVYLTLEQHKKELINLVQSPLVFTIKEYKGQESSHIVIYKIFDDEKAIIAGKALQEIDGIAQHQGNRAKKGQGDDSLSAYFNTLITAITRSQKGLLIVQESSHALNPLLEKLLPDSVKLRSIQTLQQSGVLEYNNDVTTLKAWQKQYIRQEQQGNTEQAQKIKQKIIEKQSSEIQAESANSKPDDGETHDKPTLHKPQKGKKPKKKHASKGRKNRGLKAKSTRFTRRLINPKSVEQELVDDYTAENVVNFIKRSRITTSLLKNINQENKETKLVDFMLDEANINITFAGFYLSPVITLNFFRQLSDDKKDSALSLILKHCNDLKNLVSFTSKIFQNNKLNLTLDKNIYKTLLTSGKSISFLCIVDAKLENLIKITTNKNIKIDITNLNDQYEIKCYTGFINHLIETIREQDIFEKIISAFSRKLKSKLPDIILGENIQSETNKEKISTFQTILEKPTFHSHLFTILKCKKDLLSDNNLLRVTQGTNKNIDTERKNSIFIKLIDSKKGRKCITHILNNLEATAKAYEIIRDNLFNHSKGTLTIEYILAFDDMRAELLKFISCNSGFIKSLDSDVFFKHSKMGKRQYSLFFYLITSDEGLEILKFISKEDPSFFKKDNFNCLYQTQNFFIEQNFIEDKYPFLYLLSSKNGRFFLNSLIKTNPEVLEDIENRLFKKIPNYYIKEMIYNMLLCEGENNIFHHLAHRKNKYFISLVYNNLFEKIDKTEDELIASSIFYGLCRYKENHPSFHTFLSLSRESIKKITIYNLLIRAYDLERKEIPGRAIFWLCFSKEGIDTIDIIISQLDTTNKDLLSYRLSESTSLDEVEKNGFDVLKETKVGQHLFEKYQLSESMRKTHPISPIGFFNISAKKESCSISSSMKNYDM